MQKFRLEPAPIFADNTSRGGITGNSEACQSTDSKLPSHIPTEIFDEIFNWIHASSHAEMAPEHYKHTLARLCLVSHSFCTALRPHLFKAIHLGSRSDHDPGAFCHAIISGNPSACSLARYTHTCAIALFSGRRSQFIPPPTQISYLQMYKRVLKCMPNLQNLRLSAVILDGEMIDIIGTFQYLKSLGIYSPLFGSDVKLAFPTTLQLSHLEVCTNNLSLAPIIRTASLVTLKGTCEFVAALLARGPITTLRSLALFQATDMQLLISVLSQVSSLTRLKITPSQVHVGGSVMPRWDLAVLPNLRSLACSLALAKVLVPGRPLVEFRVLDWQPDFSVDPRTIFGTTPSTTLTSLCIFPNMIPDTPIISQFPQLSELRLDFPSGVRPSEITAQEKEARLTELFDELCEKWVYHPGIKQLKINFGWDMTFPLSDLSVQYRILTGSLLKVFPGICRLQMVEFAAWERSDTSDAWRIFVPGTHRARVIERLSRGEPGLVDYEGYLQRLATG